MHEATNKDPPVSKCSGSSQGEESSEESEVVYMQPKVVKKSWNSSSCVELLVCKHAKDQCFQNSPPPFL